LFPVTWIENQNKIRYAGYDDWRLPKLEEAMRLMEPSKNNHLHINPVFDKLQTIIWTSTSLLANDFQLWVVDFEKGNCNHWKDSDYFFVRAVRSD